MSTPLQAVGVKTGTEHRPQARTGLSPSYRVLLHNDDVHDMGFVARCLVSVFSLPWADAWAIMSEAHHTGVGLCRVEPLEPAEFHRDQLQSFGLTATVEPDVS